MGTNLWHLWQLPNADSGRSLSTVLLIIRHPSTMRLWLHGGRSCNKRPHNKSVCPSVCPVRVQIENVTSSQLHPVVELFLVAHVIDSTVLGQKGQMSRSRGHIILIQATGTATSNESSTHTSV